MKNDVILPHAPGMPKVDGLSRQSTCNCPTCVTSRGIRTIKDAVQHIDDATNVWLDNACETDMSLAWLEDEVEAVLALPWWRPWRKRLRRALEVAKV